jgi:FkbM family methyltransferase
MKKLFIYLFNKLGYRTIKTSFYEELLTISNIATLDCYDLLKKYSKEQSLCFFDVGANVGHTAKKISSYFPNASIHCFEPIKDTYATLVENLKNYPNIHTYHLAMGSSTGEAEVFHREHSEWNSLVKQLNEEAREAGAVPERIKVDTIDHFVDQKGVRKIDFLKSDTEGFELEVLKGAKNMLQNQLVGMLYIEVGFDRNDTQHNYFADVVHELDQYGYAFSGLFEMCYLPDMRLHYANALFYSRKIMESKNNELP